jgi:hypothetical protein
MIYFAHEGEMHKTAAETAWHSIVGEWYIALPLYLIILFAISAAIYLASKSKAATFNTLLVILFVGGVGFYNIAPVVSIVSLAGGFGLALTIVIAGLNHSKPQTGPKK